MILIYIHSSIKALMENTEKKYKKTLKINKNNFLIEANLK